MKIIRRLLTLAVMGLAFAAAWQFGKNTEPISVGLFRWRTPDAPAWLVLLSAFGLGVVVASALLGYQLARLSLLSRRYRKAMGALESELHQLRNQPLAAGGGGPPAPALGLPAASGTAAVGTEGRRG